VASASVKRQISCHDFLPLGTHILPHQLDVGIINLLFGWVHTTCSRWRSLLSIKQRGGDKHRCREILGHSSADFPYIQPLAIWQAICEVATGSVASRAVTAHRDSSGLNRRRPPRTALAPRGCFAAIRWSVIPSQVLRPHPGISSFLHRRAACRWRHAQKCSSADGQFLSLHLYDRDAVKDHFLKVDKVNFGPDGEQRQLHAFSISSKRYDLHGRRGRRQSKCP